MRRPTALPLITAAVLSWLLINRAAAVDASSVAVEPITLFENDRLMACGVRTTFSGDGGGRFELMLVRIANERTEWALKFSPANGQVAKDSRVSLATSDTTLNLPRHSTAVDGSIESRGPLDEAAGTNLIVGFMTSGGAFKVTSTDGKTTVFDVQGPLSHEVRSGYLTCAGDLFRP
jgi:hypothetical protein